MIVPSRPPVDQNELTTVEGIVDENDEASNASADVKDTEGIKGVSMADVSIFSSHAFDCLPLSVRVNLGD